MNFLKNKIMSNHLTVGGLLAVDIVVVVIDFVVEPSMPHNMLFVVLGRNSVGSIYLTMHGFVLIVLQYVIKLSVRKRLA